MRLKLIRVMQQPPKNFDPDFTYEKDELLVAVKVGCELESAIDAYAGTKKELRDQKFKSIYYALNIQYTHLKSNLLNGDINAQQIVKWE